MEKTNWKQVFFVLIIAFVVGGAVFAYVKGVSDDINSLIASLENLIVIQK